MEQTARLPAMTTPKYRYRVTHTITLVDDKTGQELVLTGAIIKDSAKEADETSHLKNAIHDALYVAYHHAKDTQAYTRHISSHSNSRNEVINEEGEVVRVGWIPGRDYLPE